MTDKLIVPIEKLTTFLAKSSMNDQRFSWIPFSPMKFALILIVPIIVFAFLVFWGIMFFFGFEEVNFFQFWIIRLIFITLLTKPVVNLAILRYIQPKQK